ncbi:hypothetical protein P3T23_001161 [Paraburkholderia sp. GAS448]|uniref:WbqC family protein n=1 Tax=Paraburkholderia sp. GAS448 TaxID=3035136 RepID=UPI003D263BEE
MPHRPIESQRANGDAGRFVTPDEELTRPATTGRVASAPKRVAIMQPYFFPYIGYFQLIKAVDQFVVYDNIQYTKKGWINRNRFLKGGRDETFSIPLKKDSDYLNVVERRVSADFNKRKFLNHLSEAYRKAPHFDPVFALVEQVVMLAELNLFAFIRNSIDQTCAYLEIATPILVSSMLPIDHALRGSDKVIAICNALDADTYINSIGGRSLYDKDEFKRNGLTLKFLQSKPIEYRQFGAAFVPYLSIIDVMMFNEKSTVRDLIELSCDLL